MKTYNNVPIPPIMYGTAWKKAATADLTELAIKCGFRAIDTANQLKHYDEALVGEGLKRAGVPRDQVFLQTKFTSIDGQDHRLPYDPQASLTVQVQQSVDSSLGHLHTDHLDSYVLHGPFTGGKLTPQDWEVWAAIEGVYKAGKARVVGVSNFTAAQLRELVGRASVKPMMVQNRCYAIRGWDRDVRQICTEHGIIYQGFSLLTANSRELSNATIRGIASRLDATIPQVVFRFAQQIGMLPLTGTTDRQHMIEDLQSDRFELLEKEIGVIENVAILR